jgi:hypothetical protein
VSAADGTVILPCGCRVMTGMVDGERTFVIAACEADCPNVRATLELADANDSPVEIHTTDRYEVTCLSCARRLDAAMPIAGESVLPDPGAISVCAYCAAVTIYERNPDGDLYLRWPTAEDHVAIGSNSEVAAAVDAVRRRMR